MRRLAATALALLLFTTGCAATPAPPSAEGQSVPTAAEPSGPTGQTPATPLPAPAPVGGAPTSVDALFPLKLASLSAKPFPAFSPAGGTSPADEADPMAARKVLLAKIEASETQPAQGLAEMILAYFSRPDVLSEQAPEHGFPGAARLELSQLQKGSRVIVVTRRSKATGAATWQVGLLQWQEGGKVASALIPGFYPRVYALLTDTPRPVLLTGGIPAPNAPFTFSGFTFGDGQLTPSALAVTTPARPNSPNATATANGEVQVAFPGPADQLKSDPQWLCTNEACASLAWQKGVLTALPWSQGGSNLKMEREQNQPIMDQFAEADTLARLKGTTMSESAALLSERVGHPVVERTYPGTDAVARIIHEQTVVFYERGYVNARSWLQWQGGGVPYLAQGLGEDGGYIDHRILRDGDRYYVLVVTASQPRPYMGQNVLSVYRIDGDHLTRLELPFPFNTQGEKHFLGADGHEMLWDLSYAGKADWRRIRVVDGALQAELIDEATAKSLLKK